MPPSLHPSLPLRGVWELHKLSREAVLEWLSKRREADGIVSSTQKRRPERPRGGGSHLFIEDGEFVRDGTSEEDGFETAPAGRSGDRSPPHAPRRRADAEEGELMAGPSESKVEEPRPAEAEVVSMSRSEMAALRSSLPSQKTYKGRLRASKLGIKSGESGMSHALMAERDRCSPCRRGTGGRQGHSADRGLQVRARAADDHRRKVVEVVAIPKGLEAEFDLNGYCADQN